MTGRQEAINRAVALCLKLAEISDHDIAHSGLEGIEEERNEARAIVALLVKSAVNGTEPVCGLGDQIGG